MGWLGKIRWFGTATKWEESPGGLGTKPHLEGGWCPAPRDFLPTASLGWFPSREAGRKSWKAGHRTSLEMRFGARPSRISFPLRDQGVGYKFNLGSSPSFSQGVRSQSAILKPKGGSQWTMLTGHSSSTNVPKR